MSVSSAGDVNGDGYADAIVGALGYNSGQGRSYIYFGGSSIDNTADVTMTGEGTGDCFGSSVASAGDIERGECGHGKSTNRFMEESLQAIIGRKVLVEA
jgi:hypothetical protein